MGIYIKNVEMPKSCGNCFFDSHCDNWRIRNWGAPPPDDCPLVPVPPHGRLIDADALAEDGWVLTKQVMRMGGYAIHELPLKNPTIPTIIPAEEGET